MRTRDATDTKSDPLIQPVTGGVSDNQNSTALAHINRSILLGEAPQEDRTDREQQERQSDQRERGDLPIDHLAQHPPAQDPAPEVEVGGDREVVGGVDLKAARASYDEAKRLAPDLEYAWNEGTVLKTCVDRVLQRDLLRQPRSYRAGRTRAIAPIGKSWMNGVTLRAVFMGGEPATHSRIERAASEWTRVANVRFEFPSDDRISDAEIRIGFERGPSWSFIGTDARGVPPEDPTMNFGWLTSESSENDVSEVALHEFGHALGLVHEHRPPEDGIQWDRSSLVLDLGGPPNFWGVKEIDWWVLGHSTVVSNGLVYDDKSIMRLPIPRSLTLNGYAVPWNSKLSDGDRQLIAGQMWYPANTGNSQ